MQLNASPGYPHATPRLRRPPRSAPCPPPRLWSQSPAGIVRPRRRSRFVVLALAALFHLPARGQTTPQLTVDDVVAKLQHNLDLYDKSIPSFLADEHIDSIQQQFAARGASAPNFETIAESVFRLKKEIDHTTNTFSFNESRDVSLIDGKPANGRQINAPSMIFGAFSGGLAFVSQEQSPCMRYQLEPVKARKPIVVRFTTLPAAQRTPACILAEDSSGRVSIDPASMQIQRIDLDVPRHLFTPHRDDGSPAIPTIGHWKVEVTYKPVVLNAKTFWLPETILSQCSNDDTQWSFRGAYRNYHLLEVHSRMIIPNEPSER